MASRRCTTCRVQALHTYQAPTPIPSISLPVYPRPGAGREAATLLARNAIAPWTAKFPDVHADPVVPTGHPAATLVDACVDGDAGARTCDAAGHRQSAPRPERLATASGAAFAAVVLGQLANAFACRSTTRWIGRTGWRGNPLLPTAAAAELVVLAAFLGIPTVADTLGGRLPSTLGWVVAAAAVAAVLLADAAHKALRLRSRRRRR